MKYLFLTLLTATTMASSFTLTVTDIDGDSTGNSNTGTRIASVQDGTRYTFRVVQDVSKNVALILGTSFTDTDNKRINTNGNSIKLNRDTKTTTLGLKFNY
jgi:hypothetical protein